MTDCGGAHMETASAGSVRETMILRTWFTSMADNGLLILVLTVTMLLMLMLMLMREKMLVSSRSRVKIRKRMKFVMGKMEQSMRR